MGKTLKDESGVGTINEAVLLYPRLLVVASFFIVCTLKKIAIETRRGLNYQSIFETDSGWKTQNVKQRQEFASVDGKSPL